MASKLRSSRESQKALWGEKLSRRVEALSGLGLDGDRIEKDSIVRKLKAKVRETTFRLNAIAAREKKLEDMVRLREEKKAAPPKVKGKKAEAAPVEESKTAKKKKAKKEGGEEAAPKESKKKAEAAS
ncbi:MAG TPA: hypothetical protein PKM41_07710 [Deltaproteobacteria bacterium]|jgi:hypothetical protein|nr:hypothetical protein [Deltaproteobacteria bacterium]HOI07139.1 hypothetical protein [Deltaproteobacteria bacterium]